VPYPWTQFAKKKRKNKTKTKRYFFSSLFLSLSDLLIETWIQLSMAQIAEQYQCITADMPSA